MKSLRVGDVVVLKAIDHSEYRNPKPRHSYVFFAGFVARVTKNYIYLTMYTTSKAYIAVSATKVRILKSAVRRVWTWKSR